MEIQWRWIRKSRLISRSCQTEPHSFKLQHRKSERRRIVQWHAPHPNFQNFSISDKQQLALEEKSGQMCRIGRAVSGDRFLDRMWRWQQLQHDSATANCHGFALCASG